MQHGAIQDRAHLDRPAPRGRRRTRRHAPALRADRRRRAGRHRARRAAEADRRAGADRRSAAGGRAMPGASRYKSLCLHDPVWYDHLPYLPFPDHWPIYTPKDKMGDWLEVLHQDHGARLLVVDARARARHGTRPGSEWTVEVEREGKRLTAAAQASRARDRHVGLSRSAALSRRRKLQGHAASLQPAHGRRGLGGQALRRRGLEQFRPRHRRRPLGARRRGHHDPALADPGRALRHPGAQPAALFGGARGEGGITTDKADFTVASLPYALQPAASRPTVDAAQERGCRLLRTARSRRASSSPSARTRSASARCISAAARATTSMSALPS